MRQYELSMDFFSLIRPDWSNLRKLCPFEYTEAETKKPQFCAQQCFHFSIYKWPGIGLDNDLVPNMSHAIVWNRDDLVYWRIKPPMVSISLINTNFNYEILCFW